MNLKYLNEIVNEIFLTHSPTGYFGRINKVITRLLEEMNYTNIKVGNKGNIEVFIKGESSDNTVGISAHCDTLGLMIRSIGGDGSIKVTNIGGPIITVPLGFAEKYGTEAINSAKLGLYTIAQIEEKKKEEVAQKRAERAAKRKNKQ